MTEVTLAGQSVDETRTYSGATNSFFAGVVLKRIPVVTTGKLRRDVLIDYIRKKAVLRPAYDGRRVIINP